MGHETGGNALFAVFLPCQASYRPPCQEGSIQREGGRALDDTTANMGGVVAIGHH